MTALHRLFDRLDRAGPGDAATVGRALRLAGTGPDARILDAGCGPGPDVGTLAAHVPRGAVVAMDLDPGFVARIAATHAGHGRVTAAQGDMLAPEGRFDLIWSAGAVYIPGIVPALTAWRAHLRPGGRVAFTQIAWRRRAPSPAAAAFWAEYPDMTDARGVTRQVHAAGYRVIGAGWISRRAWVAYYDPLARQLDRIEAAGADHDTAELIAAFRREIHVWRAHGDDFGYRLIVAEPVP